MTYKDLTIEKYQKVLDIMKRKESDIEIQVSLIAVMNDIDEDTVLDLPLDEYSKKAREIAFLYQVPQTQGKCPKTVNLNGKEYMVEQSARNMCVGQYIDYEEYLKMGDNEKYMANILSCFIYPKDASGYCKGYDIAEVTEDIRKYMDIETAGKIAFFLRKKSLQSMNHMLISLESKMRAMALIQRDKKIKGEMKKTARLIKEMRSLMAHLPQNGSGLS